MKSICWKFDKFWFELELYVSFHDTHVLNIIIYYINHRRLGTNKTSSAVQTKLLSMCIKKKAYRVNKCHDTYFSFLRFR